ncbi:hypothetical protein BDW22DRAFT_1352463 [Trametopsis cervina]|nr:hypothetical protein BDW22DRAFT_1352463 [Trametopsis cervina]
MAKRLLHTLPLPLATLAALTRAGYETADDVDTSTPEELARDARISLFSSQAVFSATQASRTPALTQNVASMTQNSSRRYPTGCPPMDELLEGGFKRGSILEISGPPGVATEAFAVNIAREFVRDGEGLIFASMHNSITAAQLLDLIRPEDDADLTHDYMSLVSHTSLFTIADVLVFLHRLPSYLQSSRKTALLVLNSFSLAFYSLSPNVSHASRAAFHERIRQALAQACASAGISVVVTTQLSTKLVNADGSPATFDTGARAVMIPQPGSAYLPGGRSYRLMVAPRSRYEGTIQLLATPTHVYQPGQAPLREKRYEMVRTSGPDGRRRDVYSFTEEGPEG